MCGGVLREGEGGVGVKLCGDGWEGVDEVVGPGLGRAEGLGGELMGGVVKLSEQLGGGGLACAEVWEEGLAEGVDEWCGVGCAQARAGEFALEGVEGEAGSVEIDLVGVGGHWGERLALGVEAEGRGEGISWKGARGEDRKPRHGVPGWGEAINNNTGASGVAS